MVELRLGAQLTAKVLGRIGGRSADRLGHFGHVHDDRFDAVALALDLGRDARHLVPIENIGDITVNVDGSHVGELGCCCCWLSSQPTHESKAETVVDGGGGCVAIDWCLLRSLWRAQVVCGGPQTGRTSVDLLKAMVMDLVVGCGWKLFCSTAELDRWWWWWWWRW